MIRFSIVVVLLAALVSLTREAVVPASPSTVRFDDTDYGVSFSYPATWTRSDNQPFMFPLGISLPAKPPGLGSLRALVFSQSIPGVASWPTTIFAGVEFGYDVRPTPRKQTCQALASAEDSHGTPINEVTLNGIPYWHDTAGDGGMSHFISDDIYTTWIPKNGGTCVLFDLAVQSVLAPGAKPPRALTPQEQAIIHQSLQDVLSSARIYQPSQ